MGFIADDIVSLAAVTDEKAHVVVQVFGVVAASGNGMDIEIEDGAVDGLQAGELVVVFFDQVTDLPNQFAAIGSCNPGPRTFIKRFPRRLPKM